MQTGNIDDIVKKLAERDPNAKINEVSAAWEYSQKLFGHVQAGIHLDVARVLADLNMDEVTIVCALIMGVAKKTSGDLKEVKEKFGLEVSEIVESLDKLLSVRYSSGPPEKAENYRRLILSLSKDVRVVMIFLAYHLNVMRHMSHEPRKVQVDSAVETLDIYAPLANRLGIYKLKSELEDLGFKYLEPGIYEELDAKMGETRQKSEEYIAEVKGILQKLMEENQIEGIVKGRHKHLYSVYRKMIDQNIPFEKVYDRIAFRIIVDQLRDCYAILGAVHARWVPVQGRFKDYIALPKSNLYQSLHTTVIGPHGKPMEVQIRTHKMHSIAEEGIAAHWRYKEKRGANADDRIFNWLRKLVETSKDRKDEEFVEEVVTDLFPNVVYVFTPAGEVLELPKGSTPVDFAFNVHSAVGMHCVGAKVNDRMVPLNHKLKNGDRIEIITSKTQNPSADWLEFVQSHKAKNRIKAWIRTEQKARSIEIGRELCDREFRKVGKSFTKAQKDGLVEAVLPKFGVNKIDELLEAVGFGKQSPRLILERVYPEFEHKEVVEEKEPRRVKRAKKKTKGIVIKGVGDTMVRYAKCCNPLPMEPVVGFITKGQGLTVHRENCPNVLRADPNRRIEVQWGMGEVSEHPVKIRVTCEDKKGLLASITNLLAQNDVDVTGAEVKTFVVGRAECNFNILVPDLMKLNKILHEIQSIKGVYNVIRVRG